MTNIEIGFVVLVIAAFAVFMLTLAITTWWSEKAYEPSRHATKPKSAPVASQDNAPDPAIGVARQERRRPY